MILALKVRAGSSCLACWLRLALLVSLVAGTASAQDLTNLISREVSLFVGSEPTIPFVETISREVSLFAGAELDTPWQEVISREVSLFAGAETDLAWRETVSREVTLFAGAETDPAWREVASREVSALVPTANIPAPVTGISSGFTAATSTTQHQAVDLAWPNYDALPQIDVVRYRIYVSTSDFTNASNLTLFAYISAPASRTAVTGLAPRSLYYFAVAAEDALGGWNPVVCAVSAQASPADPGEVQNPQAIGTPNSIDYFWQPPADPSSSLVAYHLYFNGTTNPVSINSLATNYTVTNLLPAQAYTMRIAVFDSMGVESPGLVISTETPSAPSITAQPQDQTVTVGSSATLRATAAGSSPLAWQWLKNGVALPGATTPALPIPKTALADSGSYSVTITNVWGSVTSTPAILTVNPLTWELVGTPGSGIGVNLVDAWARQPNEAYALGEKRRSHRADITNAYLYSWNGNQWSLLRAFPGHHAVKVMGTGTNDIWVGLNRCSLGLEAGCGGDQGGKIYRSPDLGATWLEQTLPEQASGGQVLSLSGVTGNLQAVVEGGTILRYDGASWHSVWRDPAESVNALTVLGAAEGYYVTCWGWGSWDGQAWGFAGRQFDFCEVSATWAAHDSAGQLVWYAVGNNNLDNGVRVWRFDLASRSFGGKTQFVFGDGEGAGSGRARGIWGAAPADLYVVGDMADLPGGIRTGRVYHYDGQNWSRVAEMGEIPPAVAVHGTGGEDIWVALSDGRLLHLNGRIGMTQAPVISTPPMDQNVVVGDTGRFSVAARGTPPLTYQWYDQTGPRKDGTDGSALNFEAVQAADAGLYWVVVSNQFGAATSGPVTLKVIVPPRITAQPQPVQITVGSALTLLVEAVGATEYQWRRNGANIDGATNAVYQIPATAITDGGSYTVVLANEAGALTSEIAEVIVTEGNPEVADLFADRLRLILTGGAPIFVSGFTTNATKEPGEPDHARRLGGRSVWYTWRAPADGVAQFSTYGSTFDTVLAVYTGTQLTNLVEVAANDDEESNEPSMQTNRFFASRVRFNAVAGTEYAIALDSFGGVGGYAVLGAEFAPTDELLPVILEQPQDQVHAYSDALQLSVSAAGSNLVYQWYFNGQALNGQVAAELIRPSIGDEHVGAYAVRVTDSVTGQYLDSRQAAVQISSDPAQGVFLQDKLEALARVRHEHFKNDISFDTFSVGAGTIGYQVGNNDSAKTDLFEPNHGGFIGKASLWVVLKPTQPGVLSVNTGGSAINTIFAIYPWTSLDAMASQVLGWATNVAGATNPNSVCVTTMVAGSKFLVAVDGLKHHVGGLKVNWVFGSIPKTTNAVPAVMPLQRLDLGGSLTLRLTEATLTNTIPRASYQWYRDGHWIAQTTAPLLVINNCGLTQSGTYSVVTTNVLGTATNVLARILFKVPVDLVSPSARYRKGNFEIIERGTEGDTVALEATTNLLQWTGVSTGRMVGYEQTISDTNAAAFRYRFYRLRAVQ